MFLFLTYLLISPYIHINSFTNARLSEIASGGLSGVGGSMYLGAGQATGVGSVGGSIEIAAGGSAAKGGDDEIMAMSSS